MNDNFKVRVKLENLRGVVGETFNLEEFNNFEEFKNALLKNFSCNNIEELKVTAISYNPTYTTTIKKFCWDEISRDNDWDSIAVDIDNICEWLHLTLSERSLINAYLEYSLPYDNITDTLTDAHKSFYDNYFELGRRIANRELKKDSRLFDFIDYDKLADDEIKQKDLIRCGGYVFTK